MAQDMQLTLRLNADGTAMITGIKKAGKAVDDLGERANKNAGKTRKGLTSISQQLARAKSQLIGFFAASKIAQFGKELIDTADSVKQMNARLLTATGSQEAYKQAISASTRIAKEARADYQSTVNLFSRLTTAADQYDIAQNKIAKTTEAVTYGLKLYGASSAEVTSVQTQLSQAMASGVLAGDEFKSMAEASPRLMQALADGMGVARGELKQMAADGKLTTEVVVNALAGQADRLKTEFAKMPITVGEAWGQVKNKFVQGLGEFDKTNGATETLAKGLMFVAENLGTLTKSLAIATVASATFYATQKGGILATSASSIINFSRGLFSFSGAVRLATTATKGFNFAIAANPIGLIITGLTTAISYLYLFRNEIHPVEGSIANLSDYVVVAFHLIDNAISSVFPSFEELTGFVNALNEPFNNSLNAILSVFKTFLNNVKTFINKFIGFWAGSFKAIIAIYDNFPNALSGIITDAVNWALEGINDLIKGSAELLNKLPGVEIDIKGIGFEKLENNAQSAAQSVYDAFNQGMDTDYIGSAADFMMEKITAVGQEWKKLAEIEHQKNTEKSEQGAENSTLKALTQQANTTKSALKSVKEQLTAIANFKQNQTASLEDYAFETSLIGLQAQEVEKLRYEYDLWKQAQQAMQGLSEQNAQAIRNEVIALKEKRAELVAERNIAQQKHDNDWAGGMKAGLQEVTGSAGTAFSVMKDASKNAIGSMADGLANFVTTGKANFKDLTRSILADISKMLIKFAILQAFKAGMSALGFSKGGAFDSGGQFFANGGAFNQGVQFYAKGDIFNRPTAFSHAGGLGVLGEAGPEAIMPLTRGANGKLGVQVYGGNKANNTAGQINNIEISVNVNGQETQSSSQSQAAEGKRLAESLEFAIKSVLQKEMRAGGMLSVAR
ncbi:MULTISPECIES: phage tail tape measure protein [Pasteurellaceae]|uniref:Phage tail tape measure protein n=1 Tax=Pasteurella atlantica TaxID=2827233 RepID=A0AAW8CN54_9PAST|nr:phage tail tape measure protein [Pasteurella atlantica]MBR0573682.1 phage tail tape measure protein [Pasteurella atlantica]MDP8039685.1 phage tail tape measure protein [Pasteurella atlantica]MDP8041776.1 phage tail tape measure protein [Pasteurella atlantica]MDP8043950.1 phage tail tape measure protein [Pasteurella atlantica]MDP8045928.1 phage tail tape measure protein [Pasteurella atlantica]